MSKKLSYARGLFFLLLISGSFAYFFYKATTLALPSAAKPIVFYANQSRHDLKLLFCEAIHAAKHSLFASFYGITDQDIITTFSKKANAGMDVTIEYDHKASVSLPKYFPSSSTIGPRHSKGLMHRKILIVDDSCLLLGSANLTLASLRHHSNFVMGLYSPSLAHFLSGKNKVCDRSLSLTLDTQQAQCWLLPDKKALDHLLSLIKNATKNIRIAMFTFTHPQIVSALIDALRRGVEVCVIVDYYSGCGASKKALDLLREGKVSVNLSQGQQLLHHKWALIDEDVFVMGSANWTKAAFTKNDDFLFILSFLTEEQKKFLNNLWEILVLETSH